jgi:hypothetical protein
LREEHRLRVFENKMLSRVFGPKRGEVTGGWRKLLNEELHNFCSSPCIISMIKSRRMRWVRHVVCVGEIRNAYKILVGKPDGKRPFRRPRHRWEDNIKIDLRERDLECVDWIRLAQNVDFVRCLNIIKLQCFRSCILLPL